MARQRTQSKPASAPRDSLAVVSETLRGRQNDDDASRQDPGSGKAGKRAREPLARPTREPPKRSRSAPAVAWDPIDGHRLDLIGVPFVLSVGEALPAKRAAVYEGLLGSGALPVIAHKANDSTSSYLQRSLSVLEKKYADAPFSVTIRAAYDANGNDLQAGVLAVTVMVEGGCVWIDAAAFDADVRRVDPVLAASIFEHLGRATRWTYDAFTPGAAIRGAEWIMFNGDVRDWWEELRYTIVEDREAADALTPRQIREYIRENEIRTPGFVKRSIGSNHARPLNKRDARRSAMTRKECAQTLKRLPAATRTLVERLLDAIATMEQIATALEANMTPDDRSLLENEEAFMAQPGLVIETSTSHMVHEVLEELWQYAAQSEGFGLNYAFVLRADEASYRRFERSLALLQEAAAVVDGIAWAFSEFEEKQATTP